MTKVTKTVRSAIKAILADSNEYDSDTLIISRDGNVSALKDSNKTLGSHVDCRYFVGHIDDVLADRAEQIALLTARAVARGL